MCGKEKYAIGDISYVPHVLIVVAYVHCVEHAWSSSCNKQRGVNMGFSNKIEELFLDESEAIRQFDTDKFLATIIV